MSDSKSSENKEVSSCASVTDNMDNQIDYSNDSQASDATSSVDSNSLTNDENLTDQSENETISDKDPLASNKDLGNQSTGSQGVDVSVSKSKKNKIILSIVVVIAVIVCAAIYLAVFSPSAKYANAQKTFESGDYASAISQFEKLAGYEDSVQKIAECKFYQFVDYISKEGSISETTDGSLVGTTTITASGNNALKITFTQDSSISNVSLKYDYVTTLKYDVASIPVSGKTTLSMGWLNNGGTYNNELDWNIRDYTKQSKINWTKHSFLGNREDLVKSFDDASAEMITQDISAALKKTVDNCGLDITMRDLGFLKYV